MSEPATNLVVISEKDMTEANTRVTLLKKYIQSEMKQDLDFGTIPGTPKPSLYKPGAEKLARLFRLGTRIVARDRVLDHANKFYMFMYTVEVYHLDSGLVLSQCEGSTNSQEKKYLKARPQDIINTLQKMAQKRAYVGAIISAIGASEFYTQDLEDMPPMEEKSGNTGPRGAARPYLIPFGKFKGQKFESVGIEALSEYIVNWQRSIEEGAEWVERSGVEKVQECIEKAKEFLGE